MSDFLSNPVSQRHGLRNGDPIPLVLFNLAFEPLLRRILNDPHFQGFALPQCTVSHPLDANLHPIKLLAYADNGVCLLKDPSVECSSISFIHMFSESPRSPRTSFTRLNLLCLLSWLTACSLESILLQWAPLRDRWAVKAYLIQEFNRAHYNCAGSVISRLDLWHSFGLLKVLTHLLFFHALPTIWCSVWSPSNYLLLSHDHQLTAGLSFLFFDLRYPDVTRPE